MILRRSAGLAVVAIPEMLRRDKGMTKKTVVRSSSRRDSRNAEAVMLVDRCMWAAA